MTKKFRNCAKWIFASRFICCWGAHHSCIQYSLEKDYFLPQIIPWMWALGIWITYNQWDHNDQSPVGKLIQNIKDCVPHDEESGKGWGWNFPKMHTFANMPQNMLKFGIARNFSRQIGEQASKAIIKDHAMQTQRWPGNLRNSVTLENVKHGNSTSSSRKLPFSMVSTGKKSK